MTHKEKLTKVYQALSSVSLSGDGNVLIMAGVFEILRSIITELEQEETKMKDDGGTQ